MKLKLTPKFYEDISDFYVDHKEYLRTHSLWDAFAKAYPEHVEQDEPKPQPTRINRSEVLMVAAQLFSRQMENIDGSMVTYNDCVQDAIMLIKAVDAAVKE